MFNNILDKQETFFGNKNFIPFKSQNSHKDVNIVPRRVRQE